MTEELFSCGGDLKKLKSSLSVLSSYANMIATKNTISKSMKISTFFENLNQLLASIMEIGRFTSTEERATFMKFIRIMFRILEFKDKNGKTTFNLIPFSIFNIKKNIYKQNEGLLNEVFNEFLDSESFGNISSRLSNDEEITASMLTTAPCIFYIPNFYTNRKKEAKEFLETIFKRIDELKADKNRDVDAKHYMALLMNILIVLKLTDTIEKETFTFVLSKIELAIKSEFFDKQFSCLKLLSQIGEKEKYIPFLIDWYRESDFASFLVKMDFKPAFMAIYGVIFKQIASFGLLTIDGFKQIWETNKHVQESEQNLFYQMICPIFITLNKEYVHEALLCVLKPNALSSIWLDSINMICVELGKRKIFKEEIAMVTNEIEELSHKESAITKKAEEIIPVLKAIGISHEQFMSMLKEFSTKKKLSDSDSRVLSLILIQDKCEDQELVNEIFNEIIRTSKHELSAQKIEAIKTLSSNQGIVFAADHVNKLLQKAVSSQAALDMLIEFLSNGAISHETVYDAAQMLPETMINDKFFRFLYDAFYANIKSVTSLPFNEEKLLWAFATIKSSSMFRFQNLLALIYSYNDGEHLTDEKMINTFISVWETYFKQADTNAKKNNLLALLTTFINKIEENVNVEMFDITRHRLVKANSTITVDVDNSDDHFVYDADREINFRTLLYIVCEHFKLDSTSCGFEHDEFPVDLEESLREFDDQKSLSLTLVPGDSEPEPMRDSLPSKIIENTPLHKQLYESIEELNVIKILDILPTLSSVEKQLSSISKDNFEKLFPVDKKHTFIYNFETFYHMYEKDLDDILEETGLMDYLISKCLASDSTLIINEILPFISNVLDNYEIEVDNQLLFDRLFKIINDYFKVDKESQVSINCFQVLSFMENTKEIKFNEDVMKKLIRKIFKCTDERSRHKALDFLYKLDISASTYLQIYKKDSSLNTEFFTSWSDHIKQRDDEIVKIALSYLDPSIESGQLDMIDALVDYKLLTEEESDRVTEFICTNFLDLKAETKDSEAFKSAMMIASRLSGPRIVEALNKITTAKISFKTFDIDGESLELHSGSKPIGLVNLGVTCFIDSILQQLFRVSELRQLVFNYKGKDKFTLQLAKLFCSMMYSNLDAVSTKELLDSWSSDGSDPFDYHTQQDACEFLELLLDKLERSIGKEVTKIFAGKFVNRIESLDGKQKSESEEPFVTLPVDVANSKTLAESLEKISTPDFLRGDNAIKFEGSDEKVDAKKYCEVGEVPKNLIIQLKRFQYDYNTWRRYKIKSPLEFPADVEIAGSKFHLAGVVIHSGTADYGHYISLCKQQNGTWIKFNDDLTTVITEKEVLDVGSGGNGSWSAFILFYDQEEQAPVKCSPKFMKSVQEDNYYNSFCRLAFSQATTDAMIAYTKKDDNELLMNAARFAIKFAPFSVGGIQGTSILEAVDGAIKDNLEVSRRLTEELKTTFIANTLVVVYHENVKKAFASIICTLLDNCGPDALIGVDKQHEDWESFPTRIGEIMSIYEHAASIPECVDHLVKEIQPKIEQFVLAELMKKKPIDLTAEFKALLAIGASPNFIKILCSMSNLSSRIKNTDSSTVEKVVDKYGTEEDKMKLKKK